jgi:hypothetical protein
MTLGLPYTMTLSGPGSYTLSMKMGKEAMWSKWECEIRICLIRFWAATDMNPIEPASMAM